MTVPLKSLSKLLGLSDRRIQQLEKEGVVKKSGKGKYDLHLSVRRYVDYLNKRLQEAESKTGKRRQVEEDRIFYQAELLKHELALKSGDAIATQDLQREFEPVFSSMRSLLLAIPKHAARELGNKEVELYLTRRIRQTLVELANIPNRIKRLTEAARRNNSGSAQAPEAAADTHRQRVGRPKPLAQPRAQRRTRSVGNK